MAATIAQPLTNLQMELLKVFQYTTTEEDLLEIKRMLVAFFAKKVNDEMDKLWDERGWTNETMDEWLNEKNQ